MGVSEGLEKRVSIDDVKRVISAIHPSEWKVDWISPERGNPLEAAVYLYCTKKTEIKPAFLYRLNVISREVVAAELTAFEQSDAEHESVCNFVGIDPKELIEVVESVLGEITSHLQTTDVSELSNDLGRFREPADGKDQKGQ